MRLHSIKYWLNRLLQSSYWDWNKNIPNTHSITFEKCLLFCIVSLKMNPPPSSNSSSFKLFLLFWPLPTWQDFRHTNCTLLSLAKSTWKVLPIKTSHFSSSQTDLNEENLVLNVLLVRLLSDHSTLHFISWFRCEINFCMIFQNTSQHAKSWNKTHLRKPFGKVWPG